LEKELKKLVKRRVQQKARRIKTGIPILSIIGYTNAGKTTLFNLLTKSQFLVEEKMFTTLDTATRRLRFPSSLSMGRKIREVVITDTVGLIKDLPKDLIGAFRPTFDELLESDLLIHLIDISNPCFPDHIEAVQQILFDLELGHIPILRVFNKEDELSREEAEVLCQKYSAVFISAHRPESLEKFFLALEKKLWEESHSTHDAYPLKLTNGDSFDISNKNFQMRLRGTDGNFS
jgi:GTP-binding protein HflX